MLVEYIRKGGQKKFSTFNGKKKRSKRSGGKRVGVLVSWRARNGDIKIGWSLCHKNDEFDRTEGINTAKRHACVMPSESVVYVPSSIQKKYNKFTSRTQNHFNRNQKDA
jgi:hypothetical protein